MTNKALLALPALALAACEVGGYDTEEGEYTYLTAEFVEAWAEADGSVARVETDGGDTLWLSPPATPSWVAATDTAYRAVLYYDWSGTSTVSPRSLSAVTTVRPIEAQRLDTVIADPVELESVWVSATGKYLNMGVYMKIGDTGDADLYHTVAILTDSVSKAADGRTCAHLRLYHDQGGVPEYYSQKYYISVPRQSIPADSVTLQVETYDGTVTRSLSLASRLSQGDGQ